MSEPDEVTLADPADAYTFTVGMPLVLDNGALRRATWRDRVRRRLRRLLWWREARSEVSAIDHGAGSVTLVPLRWSWRRWRWERVA